MKIVLRRLLTCLSIIAVGIAVPVVLADPAEAGTKVSQGNAERQLRAAGIRWTSSGKCTTRANPTCTSFSQVNQSTLTRVIRLRRGSGCSVTITGGTEAGHARGKYSHSHGYKVDVVTSSRLTTCIDRYIRRTFRYIGVRSDGARLYRSAAGSSYANEGAHWDITYF